MFALLVLRILGFIDDAAHSHNAHLYTYVRCTPPYVGHIHILFKNIYTHSATYSTYAPLKPHYFYMYVWRSMRRRRLTHQDRHCIIRNIYGRERHTNIRVLYNVSIRRRFGRKYVKRGSQSGAIPIGDMWFDVGAKEVTIL